MKARFGLCHGNKITIAEGPHRLTYRGEDRGEAGCKDFARVQERNDNHGCQVLGQL